MNLKKRIKDISVLLKNSPIFSYWRTILFIILTVFLITFLVINFDLKLFIKSIPQIQISVFFILLLISFLQQLFSWVRYYLFMKTNNFSKIFDYISVTTVGEIVPPKPLGLYYRFLLSMKFFDTTVKDTVFCVGIDTLYEAVFIFICAVVALFIFPKADLGLELFLILIGLFGILYFVFVYYENRIYLIKNGVIKRAITYLSQTKMKIKFSILEFLKVNKFTIFVGFFLSLIKYFLGILKVCLLFFAFGIRIDFWVAFGLFSIANFVGSASSLPAGLGAFEMSFVFLASSITVNKEIAFSIAILERFFSIWIWVLFTAIYLFLTKTQIWKLHTYFIFSLAKTIHFTKIASKNRKRLKVIYQDIKRPTKKIVKKLSNKFKINKNVLKSM